MFALCFYFHFFMKAKMLLLLMRRWIRGYWLVWIPQWVMVVMLSCVQLFVNPWTVGCHAPLSMEFSRQEDWSGLPFPTPGDLTDPGIKLRSSVSPAVAGRFFITAPTGKPPSAKVGTIKWTSELFRFPPSINRKDSFEEQKRASILSRQFYSKKKKTVKYCILSKRRYGAFPGQTLPCPPPASCL